MAHTGVIWTGTDEVIPGAQDVIRFLREKVQLTRYKHNAVRGHKHDPFAHAL